MSWPAILAGRVLTPHREVDRRDRSRRTHISSALELEADRCRGPCDHRLAGLRQSSRLRDLAYRRPCRIRRVGNPSRAGAQSDRASHPRQAAYERGMARLDFKWAVPVRYGARFLEGHPFARDLDLFGPASLFQLLDTARTEAGEETLASWLASGAASSEVVSRQGAVGELKPKVDFREDLAVLAAGAPVGKTGADSYVGGVDACRTVSRARALVWNLCTGQRGRHRSGSGRTNLADVFDCLDRGAVDRRDASSRREWRRCCRGSTAPNMRSV